MRRHLFYLALVAVAVLTVGASSTLAARGSGTIAYSFSGRLLADAGNSATLYVDVNGGNRAALRKLIGQGDNQHFAVDANTEYLRWTNGVPTVVFESGIAASSLSWTRILHDVAVFTRAGAYDRAGLGWSDPARHPRTVARMLGELRGVLAGAAPRLLSALTLKVPALIVVLPPKVFAPESVSVPAPVLMNANVPAVF